RRNPERSPLVDEQRVYAIGEQAIGGELLNSLAVVSRKAGVGAEQDRPIGLLRDSSNVIGWEPVKQSHDSPSMNVGLLKILLLSGDGECRACDERPAGDKCNRSGAQCELCQSIGEELAEVYQPSLERQCAVRLERQCAVRPERQCAVR